MIEQIEFEYMKQYDNLNIWSNMKNRQYETIWEIDNMKQYEILNIWYNIKIDNMKQYEIWIYDTIWKMNIWSNMKNEYGYVYEYGYG